MAARFIFTAAAAVAVGFAHSHRAGHHQCVHDYIQAAFSEAPPQPASRQLYLAQEEGHGRRTQTVYAPIRITFDTSRLEANA